MNRAFFVGPWSRGGHGPIAELSLMHRGAWSLRGHAAEMCRVRVLEDPKLHYKGGAARQERAKPRRNPREQTARNKSKQRKADAPSRGQSGRKCHFQSRRMPQSGQKCRHPPSHTIKAVESGKLDHRSKNRPQARASRTNDWKIRSRRGIARRRWPRRIDQAKIQGSFDPATLAAVAGPDTSARHGAAMVTRHHHGAILAPWQG